MVQLPERWFGDTGPNETYPIWSRANTGEVYPSAASPLAATSTFFDGGERGWMGALTRFGAFSEDEFDPNARNTLGVFGGYVYLNVSIMRVFGLRTPGMTPQLVTEQYIGDLGDTVPSYEEEARPGDESAAATAAIEQWMAEVCFGRADVPELLEQRQRTLDHVAARGDLTAIPDADVIARFRAGIELYEELFEQHIHNSGAVGLGLGTVDAICQAIGQPDLTMLLVAGAGDVDSAAPAHAMWELSRQVRSSPTLTGLFDAGVDGLYDRISGAAGDDIGAFQQRLGDFLDSYGSRGPNEWEIAADVWGTNPDIALAAVDVMRRQDDSGDPTLANTALQSRRDEARAAVRDALAAADEATQMQFEAGLRASQLWGAARERSKTTCILFVHEMRLAALELGRRAAEAGGIEDPAHVFMLTNEELEAFASDPGSFRDELRARHQQYQLLLELEPPFVVAGEPPPIASWPRRDAHRATPVSEGDVLTGIPGCPGVHKGRARVVLDAADPKGLEPGDILVAPITDPAWTPLFVPAGAVVVDVGAQITHAVIVSRELAIPCVVSVTDATHRIPDGALIEVDGGAGKVTVLELP